MACLWFAFRFFVDLMCIRALAGQRALFNGVWAGGCVRCVRGAPNQALPCAPARITRPSSLCPVLLEGGGGGGGGGGGLLVPAKKNI
jgi:hypothetical protein